MMHALGQCGLRVLPVSSYTLGVLVLLLQANDRHFRWIGDYELLQV